MSFCHEKYCVTIVLRQKQLKTFFLRCLDIMEKVKEKTISAGLTIAFSKCAGRDPSEDEFRITIKGTESFCLC